jgi:predicted RNA binding protein YcfA (HicA-like mRNA interferase family)
VSVLPQISGRKVVTALAKVGYEKDRQKGSHIVLRQAAYPHRRLVIPDHREIAKGTLRAIIKQAGLTLEEFNELLS